MFTSLAEAIEWAHGRWDDRAVPIHLHERGVEPDSLLGAPKVSAAFLRWLLFGTVTGKPKEGYCARLGCDQPVREKGDRWCSQRCATYVCDCISCKADGVTSTFSKRRKAEMAERCSHARVPSYERVTACPDCMGTGFIEKRRDAWLYPMAVALAKLAKEPPLNRGQPTPYAIVLMVAMRGWQWRGAASFFGYEPDVFEALALLSFRKLESRYHVGPPTRIGWTQKSESQQNAELSA